MECCQRVVIAIALVCNPKLLIADEPTTALDVTIQAQILSMICDLQRKYGTSVIMITHDLGVVAETCDKVGIMYAGEIVEYGTLEDIFTGENHHPYTTGLFGSIPNLQENARRLHPIEGLCLIRPTCQKDAISHQDAVTAQNSAKQTAGSMGKRRSPDQMPSVFFSGNEF